MRSLRRFSPTVHTLAAAALALCVVLLAVACAACDASRLDERTAMQTAAVPHVIATTSTIAPPPKAERPPERTSRSGSARNAVRAEPTSLSMDATFWRRLANCESSDGRSGAYLGYFQFSRDTARKVGWFDDATYDDQVVMAQRWLAMIGGPSRGGTRSGWPVCWWRALRG